MDLLLLIAGDGDVVQGGSEAHLPHQRRSLHFLLFLLLDGLLDAFDGGYEAQSLLHGLLQLHLFGGVLFGRGISKRRFGSDRRRFSLLQLVEGTLDVAIFFVIRLEFGLSLDALARSGRRTISSFEGQASLRLLHSLRRGRGLGILFHFPHWDWLQTERSLSFKRRDR